MNSYLGLSLLAYCLIILVAVVYFDYYKKYKDKE